MRAHAHWTGLARTARIAIALGMAIGLALVASRPALAQLKVSGLGSVTFPAMAPSEWVGRYRLHTISAASFNKSLMLFRYYYDPASVKRIAPGVIRVETYLVKTLEDGSGEDTYMCLEITVPTQQYRCVRYGLASRPQTVRKGDAFARPIKMGSGIWRLMEIVRR